ncbi:MAG TPA: UMP kinase [Thiotrichales bacterium]|nr:UMP kinase [Thiotrichales bacterium]
MPEDTSKYKRILLKLSGEVLMGEESYGIDPSVIGRIADEIVEVTRLGVQVGLVIGGGNIFRGAGLVASGIQRVTGDHMGMLATVMNALAMQDTLGKRGVEARVMSAFAIQGVCEGFDHLEAIRHLEAGRVVLFAAGTGNPFFTTDSAASLRAIEIGADALLKATKVDGVYSDDPVRNPDAVRYERLTYDEVISRGLGVMDITAVVLCRDHHMPLKVFSINNSGDLVRMMKDDRVGTTVERGER